MALDSNSAKNATYNQILDMMKYAMGPSIGQVLDDPQVIEIMLNPDGKLWIDILGKGCEYTGIIIKPLQSEQIIRLVSSSIETCCDAQHPILSAELPGDGSRFEAHLSPTVENPTFSIRKKALQVFSLDDYVDMGIMTKKIKDVIIEAVWKKKNILVAGGTSSGKTTLVNAILAEIALTHDRIILIEDTVELQCKAENLVPLRTSRGKVTFTEKGEVRLGVVTMNDLLKSTMRLRPDRIVVGEVRDGASLTLLKAWNTGHPGGCATVHSNGAVDALKRLEVLNLEAGISPQSWLVGDSIDLVIFIEKYGNGRKVRNVVEVDKYDTVTQDYVTREVGI